MTPEWTYHNPDSAMFLDAMVWLDGHRGMVFGDATEGCFTLLSTHDGGIHWDRLPCGSLPAPQEGEAAFAASTGTWLATATPWIFTGGLTSVVSGLWTLANRGHPLNCPSRRARA